MKIKVEFSGKSNTLDAAEYIVNTVVSSIAIGFDVATTVDAIQCVVTALTTGKYEGSRITLTTDNKEAN